MALAFTVLSTLVVSGAMAASAQTRRPTGRPPAPAAARHPPFKAIFEPVYYPYDVEISDVFFVDPENGWVCGRHQTPAGDSGFIVATRDGGKTWSIQAGDRDSPMRAFEQLFFLDATHGWAAQADGTLFRTIDGVRWTAIAAVDPSSPFVFVSPDRGFYLGHGEIRASADGGTTWTSGHRCRAQVATAGVMQERDCEPATIAFAPDRATGYVVTRPLEGGAAEVIKTTDGGLTWTPLSRIAGTREGPMSLAFPDPASGYLRTGGELRSTSDGGQTWHAVTVMVPDDPPLVRARGSVGWMVGSHDFSYTLDGGRRWIARRVDFPARVVRFTVVADDTGYVVGSHGMIYRYRVVPFGYAVPDMLTIPGMTTFVVDGS